MHCGGYFKFSTKNILKHRSTAHKNESLIKYISLKYTPNCVLVEIMNGWTLSPFSTANFLIFSTWSLRSAIFCSSRCSAFWESAMVGLNLFLLGTGIWDGRRIPCKARIIQLLISSITKRKRNVWRNYGKASELSVIFKIWVF